MAIFLSANAAAGIISGGLTLASDAWRRAELRASPRVEIENATPEGTIDLADTPVRFAIANRRPVPLHADRLELRLDAGQRIPLTGRHVWRTVESGLRIDPHAREHLSISPESLRRDLEATRTWGSIGFRIAVTDGLGRTYTSGRYRMAYWPSRGLRARVCPATAR